MNTTLHIHARRISTLLTSLQLMGFAPMIYWLCEQNYSKWEIFFIYVAIFIHYAINNILYHGAKKNTGRNSYVLTWLVFYAAEFVGLFVFGVYSVYSALTWPERGWPSYYIKTPIVLSVVCISVATLHMSCWVIILRLYTVCKDASSDMVTIMSASSLKADKDINLT